jgi:hypothetical protein
MAAEGPTRLKRKSDIVLDDIQNVKESVPVGPSSESETASLPASSASTIDDSLRSAQSTTTKERRLSGICLLNKSIYKISDIFLQILISTFSLI